MFNLNETFFAKGSKNKFYEKKMEIWIKSLHKIYCVSLLFFFFVFMQGFQDKFILFEKLCS